MDNYEILLFVIMSLHLVLCPFTKVEESFNMQALHDILYNRFALEKYDHHEFPGVVPRTFLGPLFVSLCAAPIIAVISVLEMDKFTSQIVVRAVLGAIVCGCFIKYKRVVAKEFSDGIARMLLLLTITQFHFLFYITRSLPNVFALAPVLLASAYWLEQRYIPFIWFSALAAVVFRGEVAILVGLMAFYDLLLQKTLKFQQFLSHGILAGIAWLILTVLVDSLFWHRWLWPEGEVLWFNTVQNKSSLWGTSPFLWYFYSAMPRALLFTLLLVPVGLCLEPKFFRLFIPAFGFVLLYSFLPHKELRFIVYVFPLFNTIAAPACDVTDIRRTHAHLKKLFTSYIPFYKKSRQVVRAFNAIEFCIMFHFIANIALLLAFLTAAYHNYPSGLALLKLQGLESSSADVHVHIDVYCAQNGITRFVQLNDHWRYNKTEGLRPTDPRMLDYTHLMIGVPDRNLAVLEHYKTSHVMLFNMSSYRTIKFDRNSFPPVSVVTVPRVFVLKKQVPVT